MPLKSTFLWGNWRGEPVYRIWWDDGTFGYFSNSGEFAKRPK